MSIDRKTGDIWAADVGQDFSEEVNIVKRGANYGWSIREASYPFSNKTVEIVDPLVNPVWEYDHQIGKSITGGFVYRGTRLPELSGMYVYADFILPNKSTAWVVGFLPPLHGGWCPSHRVPTLKREATCLAENTWDRLPACRTAFDRLEAYPTFPCRHLFPARCYMLGSLRARNRESATTGAIQRRGTSAAPAFFFNKDWVAPMRRLK